MKILRMRFILCLVVSLIPASALAGDDASGPVRYSVDLGQPFTKYEILQKDRDWSTNLARKFGYSGKIVHFVLTTLPLLVDGTRVDGVVYEAIEIPEHFYVINGDAMLRVGARWPISPGCGGFSMHAPESKAFITCFNCQSPCVPFLSGSAVVKGEVTWNGRKHTRF